jgi:nuclear cap-binding protein subunit 1
LPVKTGVYGTLVGLINVKNFEFGKEVVQKTSTMLQSALDKNTFQDIKLIVRFIGELVNANVLVPSSIIEIFNQFLSVSSEESSKRADYFLHLVVQTLPWVTNNFATLFTSLQIGKELSERKPGDLAKIMETIDSYMSKRKNKANPILHTFEVDAVCTLLEPI